MIRKRFIYLIILIITNVTNIDCNKFDNRIDQYVDADGKCSLPLNIIREIGSYQPIVKDIVEQILNGDFKGDTWDSLAKFIDKFGPRLSGSQPLEDSIDYMLSELKTAGLENVHTEPAEVPHWVRGFESAELIEPHKLKLPILGLGSSVGTPRGGIIGEVVVVESFDEFGKLKDELIHGKIIIFAPKWESYDRTVQYRSKAASLVGARGGIATLIRSITPFSIGSPHTGWQSYTDGVKKIPTACITVEDAEMLLRIYRRGDQIKIHLQMEDINYPTPFLSRNTISELQGSLEKNTSVVVVSGHLDSWDVGVGAMDDGGGAFISWKAIEYLKKMGLRPKRTIRSILWTGEEEGIWGARAYKKQHSLTENEEFNFFIESDIGTFEPRGLDFIGNDDAKCIFQEILKLMSPLNATEFVTPTDGGPDIEQWTSRGFPGASLLNKNEKYFWFHHSYGDSMLLERPENLDKCSALFAAAAYVIADLSFNIPKDV